MIHIPATLTGLLWIDKKDLSETTLDTLRASYSYPHPFDDSSVFESYVELSHRIGIPYGDTDKALRLLPQTTIEDSRVTPTFTHKAELKGLVLHKYQQEVVDQITRYLKSGGTTLNLAGNPSAGKSISLAALLVKLNTKALIIAHMSMLTTQLFREFTQNTTADVRILDAKNMTLGDINIATSQFVAKRPALWEVIKKGIGVLVVDEAESLASNTTLRIFQRAHARYKIAVTATFTRSVDARTSGLTDIIGHEKFTLQNKDLLVPEITLIKCPEVYPVFTNTAVHTRQKLKFYRTKSLFVKVCALIDIALSTGRQVLVAVDIQEFQELLQAHYTSEVVGVLNSTTKKAAREDILQKYQQGQLTVLVAGMVVNAGLSIPKISTIIRVSFPSSPEKNVQLVGRALRHSEGKVDALVWDLVFPNKNPTARVAAYREYGYTVKTKTYEEFLDDSKRYIRN